MVHKLHSFRRPAGIVNLNNQKTFIFQKTEIGFFFCRTKMRVFTSYLRMPAFAFSFVVSAAEHVTYLRSKAELW